MNLDHFINMAGVAALFVGISILTVSSMSLISSILTELSKKNEDGEYLFPGESSDELRASLCNYSSTIKYCIVLTILSFGFIGFVFSIFTLDSNKNIIRRGLLSPQFEEELLRFLNDFHALEIVYAFIAIYVGVIIWKTIYFYEKSAQIRNTCIQIRT